MCVQGSCGRVSCGREKSNSESVYLGVNLACWKMWTPAFLICRKPEARVLNLRRKR
ncbi:hypothetical protein YC2023_045361 [Brassica napus]